MLPGWKVWFFRCGRFRSGPAATLLLLLAALWGMSGCAPGVKEAWGGRLLNGAQSQEALARKILQAIAAGDLQAMKDLALTKMEFQRFVWPELPVSNPKTNISVDYVWNDLYFRSMVHMQRCFGELKGKKIELVRVVHSGRMEEYPTHRAYPDMEVIIREAGAEGRSYPLFGTLIEMDGLWKVYSYAPYD
jgi:hypothetical protein